MSILRFSFLLVFVSIATAQTPPDTPAPAPTRVSSSDQQKKLVKKVDPVYPKDAFDAKLTAVVSLQTIIGVDGKVVSVRPISAGNELLIKAAEDAVKQWVYKPTVVNGKPVEVLTIIQIDFKVGEQ